jgi:hypothetical protein
MAPGGARRWLVASLLALAALTMNATAKADPFGFANFDLTNANQPFSFTNNGGTSGTISASAQVNFNFTQQTGLSTANHAATLTITGSTFTPAQTVIGIVDQPISNISTLTLTDNVTHQNLLTMTFTGQLVGSAGGASAEVIGSDTAGAVVQYKSDFLAFNEPGNSYTLGLNTLAPAFTIGAGGFLNSFVANITGQFTANAIAVPEPASVVMYGTGIVGALVLVRRRKRLSKLNRS